MLGACKQASRLLSKAQDLPLTFGERLQLRFHLSLCDKCRNFSRQLQMLRRIARQGSERTESDPTL
ncbi:MULTISPECIES: zf-HC2 domain-containing protein [Silvimonas]|uniref:zf-HC2 domain-containing protein n=1 Tax=Silvimonas TaxID=300264 RepID=UPI0024B3C41A|nr:MULTISPECIES: zf-HC2 domain-containing protein [Silvimonas]MDR3429771.1 zf-HC2 domain-containing protein [Silvimonas sp.]